MSPVRRRWMHCALRRVPSTSAAAERRPRRVPIRRSATRRPGLGIVRAGNRWRVLASVRLRYNKQQPSGRDLSDMTRASGFPAALRIRATRVHYSAGATVFHIGSPTHSVFFVETGAVRLVRYGRAGEEVVLHDASAGEFFAEASLDSARYHCDAVALAPTDLLQVPAAALRELLESDREFAREWVALLARQLRAVRSRVERLSSEKRGGAGAAPACFGGPRATMRGRAARHPQGPCSPAWPDARGALQDVGHDGARRRDRAE